MCHFITLIVPTDDAGAISAVMDRRGRAARPINNASIRKVLHDGEHQYLTARGHCDCGTVLASRGQRADEARTIADEEARLRRKGWSDAKIARALDDRGRTQAKPGPAAPDTFELWESALQDLRSDLKLPYAGLFVRFYSGAVGDEVFTASRREVRAGPAQSGALATIKEDEVTIFW